ncbi:hypothetical protein GE09DRAFT_1086754 [Coniochaeta sp. 2T2.1]|nr:hypothetical protein GE09DRAFT_1086754 [Coniochaeta sp. 2T2.1]
MTGNAQTGLFAGGAIATSALVGLAGRIPARCRPWTTRMSCWVYAGCSMTAGRRVERTVSRVEFMIEAWYRVGSPPLKVYCGRVCHRDGKRCLIARGQMHTRDDDEMGAETRSLGRITWHLLILLTLCRVFLRTLRSELALDYHKSIMARQ